MATNGPASDDNSNWPTGRSPPNDGADHSLVKDGKKETGGNKTLWVTIFRCFHCGKHGHNLPKCRQCSQAYYCDADCQRKLVWRAVLAGAARLKGQCILLAIGHAGHAGCVSSRLRACVERAAVASEHEVRPRLQHAIVMGSQWEV